MSLSLATVALLVDDYDRAIAYYRDTLGFSVFADEPLGPDRRWVVVGPAEGRGARLLLARAVGPDQERAIGRQAGGRVGFFLETDDFARDHSLMVRRGVRFLEPARHERYGIVAVFEDLYANRWDLIEPRSGPNRGEPT